MFRGGSQRSLFRRRIEAAAAVRFAAHLVDRAHHRQARHTASCVGSRASRGTAFMTVAAAMIVAVRIARADDAAGAALLGGEFALARQDAG